MGLDLQVQTVDGVTGRYDCKRRSPFIIAFIPVSGNKVMQRIPSPVIFSFTRSSP
ncbi:hypothetical protein CHISP_1065 [Chitinispirillum alkaliphilum]|nr:hypothetical protein CHISP_1065 [Chitinispirillum alkaliphilum]